MYRKINSLFIRLKNFIRIHFSRSYTASLEGAYDFTVRNFGHQFKLPDVRFPVDKDTLNAEILRKIDAEREKEGHRPHINPIVSTPPVYIELSRIT
jgi:hypothetical protein